MPNTKGFLHKKMIITLPPRSNGSPIQLNTPGSIVVIGANGAGKTRFARSLAADMPRQAFYLSALRALYTPVDSKTSIESIDKLYDSMIEKSHLLRPDIAGELNRLIALLLHDEMVNLLAYKGSVHSGDDNAKLKRTKLDFLISRWQEIFPENKILIESGRLFISSRTDGDSYSMMRLSDGEKAVMYHLGASLYAPRGGIIIVDNPGMFLHPSIHRVVWDIIEQARPDCTFVYLTHDLGFATTRINGQVVWVRAYDASRQQWEYDLLSAQDKISEELIMSIVGARKPVLFIEGDGVNSIDAKLYPLIFKEYTIKSLGSCNKVIEATRAFNDLSGFHALDSRGIVDRDRRDEREVAYLRGRKVLVPDVAEIENILMLEEVVRAVASANGLNENHVFAKVKKAIIRLFTADLRAQALLHTRHRVKSLVEHRVDGRFDNINTLEEHLVDLMHEINPRGIYEHLCKEFHSYVSDGDYASILRVYNRKSMIPESNVARYCGLSKTDKKHYLNAILGILRKTGSKEAERITNAVRRCLEFDTDVTTSTLSNPRNGKDDTKQS